MRAAATASGSLVVTLSKSPVRDLAQRPRAALRREQRPQQAHVRQAAHGRPVGGVGDDDHVDVVQGHGARGVAQARIGGATEDPVVHRVGHASMLEAGVR